MSLAVLSTFHVHPTEDLLEEYVFGRLQEPALSIIEDHLLTCSCCQLTLAQLDDYIRATKVALAELQHAHAAPAARAAAGRLPGARIAIWAAALMVVLAGSATLSWRRQPSSETIPVKLAAFRGGDGAGFAHAPAGKPLELVIDGTTLPAGAYRLQIVNAAGKNIWTGEALTSGATHSLQLPKGLRQGVYWVRLYASQATGEPGLLREFGLRLE